MSIYLLSVLLLAIALLAHRYGTDSRDGRDWQVRP